MDDAAKEKLGKVGYTAGGTVVGAMVGQVVGGMLLGRAGARIGSLIGGAAGGAMGYQQATGVDVLAKAWRSFTEPAHKQQQADTCASAEPAEATGPADA